MLGPSLRMKKNEITPWGSTGNYFQGFGEQAHSFRDLGGPAKK